MSFFKFPIWTPHLPQPVPALPHMTISMWSAFPETTVYTEFIRKGKERNGGQGPVWSTHPPLTISALTPSVSTPLASFLLSDWGRQVPPHSLCTGCSHCLECSSPRYLHGSRLTSLKPFSNATFSVRLPGPLFNTVTSFPAHSNTPDILPATSLFILLIIWHLSPSTTLLNLLNYYVPCLLCVSFYQHISSTETGIFVLFPDLFQAL